MTYVGVRRAPRSPSRSPRTASRPPRSPPDPRHHELDVTGPHHRGRPVVADQSTAVITGTSAPGVPLPCTVIRGGMSIRPPSSSRYIWPGCRRSGSPPRGGSPDQVTATVVPSGTEHRVLAGTDQEDVGAVERGRPMSERHLYGRAVPVAKVSPRRPRRRGRRAVLRELLSDLRARARGRVGATPPQLLLGRVDGGAWTRPCVQRRRQVPRRTARQGELAGRMTSSVAPLSGASQLDGPAEVSHEARAGAK
jgi:hypothetical protein